MGYRVLADLTVVLHLLFIVFVVAGGVLAIKWRWVVWLHLPALIWGACIEFMGWVCPLTPLENWFRMEAGQIGYSGGFIEQYLLPVIYPAGLTRPLQYFLGVSVLVINIVVYMFVIGRTKRKGHNRVKKVS